MPADWYCGDTHSINQLNCSLLRLLSKKFTPHIKKIVDKATKIGSFNDPAYQQAIRGTLNRIEGYHQLISKIGGVNGGKFRGTTEADAAGLLLIASFITVA